MQITVRDFDNAYFLFDLARLHREKWQKNSDIKLLKIAYDLENEGRIYLRGKP